MQAPEVSIHPGPGDPVEMVLSGLGYKLVSMLMHGQFLIGVSELRRGVLGRVSGRSPSTPQDGVVVHDDLPDRNASPRSVSERRSLDSGPNTWPGGGSAEVAGPAGPSATRTVVSSASSYGGGGCWGPRVGISVLLRP